MKNFILITGGEGYLGLHITVALIAQGYNLVVMRNSCCSNTQNTLEYYKHIYNSNSEIKIIGCDLCSRSSTEQFIETVRNAKINIIAICHFAGMSDPSGYVCNSRLNTLLSTNVVLTSNALLIANKLRPDKFIFPNSFSSLLLQDCWSYFGLSKHLCDELIISESLFNNDTSFISIYLGTVIGEIPFLLNHVMHTSEQGLINVLLTGDTSGIKPNLSPAMRHNIFPVSVIEFIGCVMYAITFDNNNDQDLYCCVAGKRNEPDICSVTRLYSEICSGYLDSLDLLDLEQYLEKICKIDSKEKQTCDILIVEDMMDMFANCIPPKLLAVPPNAPTKFIAQTGNRYSCFYERINALLAEKRDMNNELQIIKEFLTVDLEC